MAQKKKKSFQVPPWIDDILETEGDRYGGKGVITAASIYAFSLKRDSEKKGILNQFRHEEIKKAYEAGEEIHGVIDEIEAANQTKVQRRKPHRRPA